LVAVENNEVNGHVVCTRGYVGSAPALGLGPLGVRPDLQKSGVGQALMHAVIGAADALDEPAILLLGHQDYYPRFGFRPATELGIIPPDPAWGAHFQVRTLAAYTPSLRGEFRYAAPFSRL
jgi:putative acetyltransferase